MALDVYAVCPCGSNKKLKFCCHGLESSIEQVVRHQSAKQYKQALQVLDALDKKHPQSAWVKNLQAFTLMMDKRGPEAIGPLTKVLQVQPDNLYSIALFGLASFLGSGWKNGKTAIQRAFQRCSNEYPHIIYFLARSIAEFMGSIGSPLAHRQYLGLAMRLSNEENRENVFMELIEFDGDTKIPYILRGSHDLVPVAGDAAFEKEIRKAAKLAFLGCNEGAAGLLRRWPSQPKQNWPACWVTTPPRNASPSPACGGIQACVARGTAMRNPRPKLCIVRRNIQMTSRRPSKPRRSLKRWAVVVTASTRIASCRRPSK